MLFVGIDTHKSSLAVCVVDELGRQLATEARHTANLDARLADARRTLGIAWRYYDELEEIGGRLIRERMSAAEFERFLAAARAAARAARATRRTAGAPCATSSACARRSRPPTARRPTSRTSPAPAGARCKPCTPYVDHVQPTRATAGRSHQEARFERATEPAALKDRALALLTEGGTQS